MAFSIRVAQNSDRSDIKSIWKTAFNDSDEEIERFFAVYFEPSLAAVAIDGEKPV